MGSFTKVPRMSSSEGRGSYWKLEPGAESIIFKRTARNVSKTNSANTSLNISTDGNGVVTTGGQQVLVQQPVNESSNNVIYVHYVDKLISTISFSAKKRK